MAKSTNKKATLFSALKKVILFTIVSVSVLLIVAFIIVNSKKDDIIPIVIENLNGEIEGEIVYRKASVSSFKHFPYVSLILEDPSLFADKNEHKDTLVSFKYLDLSFDILDLIKSNITLTQLAIHDGKIIVEQEADSSYSLINALQNFEEIPDTLYKEHNIQISIAKIEVNSVKVIYSQIDPQVKSHTSINSLTASFIYQNDSISSNLKLDAYVNELKVNNTSIINDLETKIESDLVFNINKRKLALQNTQAHIAAAFFTINGEIDFKEKKEVYIEFEADDKDLHFTKSFFSNSKKTEIIKSGNLYLNGSIKGPIIDGFPLTIISFGSKELNIQIPKSDNLIENLNFTGSFNSGDKRDLSSAVIKVNNIAGKLPEGYLKGDFKLSDFQDPYIDYFIDLESDLEGYDNLFSNSSIDSLSGSVKFKNSFRGFVLANEFRTKDSLDMIDMEMKNVAIKLSDNFFINDLDASIKGDKGDIQIDSLSVDLNGSVISLNGTVKNYLALLFNTKEISEAKLKAKSDSYDFPAFFAFDDNIATSFPYEINNANLEVTIRTSFNDLSQFQKTPHIEFMFSKLEAEIPEFCAPLYISNGEFILGESNDEVLLDFNDFRMEVGGKKVDCDFFYSFSDNTNDSIVVSADLRDLDLLESLYLDFLAPLRDSSKIVIDGDFQSTLVWKTDSLNIIKSFDLENERLVYIEDTILFSYSHCKLKGSNISKIIEEGYSPFSTINGEIKVNIEDLYTAILSEGSIDLEINADSGKINIDAYDHQISRELVKFNVKCRPFDSIPSYRVKYKLQDQLIQDLLATYYSESILLGSIDLDLDLSFQGTNSKEILSTLDGNMLLKGDSLKIMGFDLDNVIKKFKRSQSFNLVDIGAVVVIGPVGIIYSKGTDYAIMLAGNKGDSSLVTQFKSEWDIDNGRFLIEDLAFATEINRMAAKGWMDMKVDSLDLTIAIIDEYGCNIISQNMTGDIKDPEESKVKVVKTVIAPITNLVTDVLSIDCDVFYEGTVKHPVKKKKRSKDNSENEES